MTVKVLREIEIVLNEELENIDETIKRIDEIVSSVSSSYEINVRTQLVGREESFFKKDRNVRS